MTFEFPRLIAEVSSPHPTAPQKAVKLSLNGSGSVDLKREVAALKLKSGLDDTNLSGSLDIRGFDRPRVAFDLSADQLDLDRHFPAAPKSGSRPLRRRRVAGADLQIPRSTSRRCVTSKPPETHGSASCACAASMQPTCGSTCRRPTAGSRSRRSPRDSTKAR